MTVRLSSCLIGVPSVDRYHAMLYRLAFTFAAE